MSHQSGPIKEPLLKSCPKRYTEAITASFNCLLKIGLDKGTSKSKAELVNIIVEPILSSYRAEQDKVRKVFEGEPTVITDYSWAHNAVKDEVFLQFVKQMMLNEQKESLGQLLGVLEVVTRHYCPSPQLLYTFLHFLKTMKNKNLPNLDACFTNVLLSAQAYEKYRGNNVTALEGEVFPKEQDCYALL